MLLLSEYSRLFDINIVVTHCCFVYNKVPQDLLGLARSTASTIGFWHLMNSDWWKSAENYWRVAFLMVCCVVVDQSIINHVFLESGPSNKITSGIHCRYGNNLAGSMIMSGNEAWNWNVFRRWRKVGKVVTLSVRLFQIVGLVTGNWEGPAADGIQFNRRH